LKKRLSAEYTMLAILEYICLYASNTPVSKYRIMRIEGLSTQRPDRIARILEMLERNGYIESIKTPTAIYYKVTEKGLNIYNKWVKDFLEFVRELGKVG